MNQRVAVETKLHRVVRVTTTASGADILVLLLLTSVADCALGPRLI